MADFESDIRIGVDTSQALAAIKNLQREISAFQTSMNKGSAAQAAKAGQLQQELVSSINSTGKFSASFKNVKTTTEAFTNALEKNKLSLGQYFKYAGASTKSFGKLFQNEMSVIDKTARERVKDLQTQYIKLGRDANGAMRSIAVRPLSLDLEDFGTKTAMAAQKQQILNQLLRQGSTNLLNFGKNTQWAGRQLMVGFTIPLTIFGGIASKTFMELEAQVISFKKVYGDLFTSDAERNAALKDIEALAKGFTKYGISVADTIGLAAEAAAAGFGGVDLQRQTEQATRLSVLGQLDQQKALETTISLQNAFRLSSEDLADSINFLNAVENQTVVSLDDITTAIPKVAPVIQSLGGDVKDLAFFLAAMKEGGVNASEGANALKSGLASLINPTEKASGFLSDLGINIKGIIQNNAGDLKATVLEFASALDTLDPINRARAIEEMFGKFQFARLSTLFDNVIGSGTQASRVLDLAGSSASDLASIAETELGMSASSSMNKFKKSVEDLQFALAPIGELFLKIVTPFIDFATSVIDKFNSLDERAKAFLAGLLGLLGVIGPVALMTFGLLANGIANIVKGFIAVRGIFQKAGTQTEVLGNQTEYLTQQQIDEMAVAASLEQVHNRLTQAFTSEALAIDKLTAAYGRAIAKQRQFASPGISSSIAGAGAKAKGYASGGLVRGPGSGTSDSIPALLSNGEFVMPAKEAEKFAPVLEAMRSGQLPGYSEGGSVGNNFSMSNSKKSAGLYKAPSIIASQTTAMDWATASAEAEAVKRAVFEMLGETQQTVSKVNNLLLKQASHVVPATVQTNVAGQMVDIKSWEAVNLQGDMGYINNFLNAAQLSTAFLNDFESTQLDTVAKKLGISMEEAKREMDDLRKGLHPKTRQSGQFLQEVGAYAATPSSAGSKNLKYQGAAVQAGMGARLSGDYYETLGERGYDPSLDKKAADQVAKRVERLQGLITEAVSTEAKKDSPKAKKAGKEVATKVVQAVEQGVIEGSSATAPTQARVSQSYKVFGQRRATTNQSVRIGAIASQTPVMGQVASGEAYSVLTKELTKASDIVEQSGSRFQGMNSKMMNLSFALSSVGMMTSMFGEEMNGLQNIIYGASSALMALTSVIELARMVELKNIASKGASGLLDLFKSKAIGSKIGDAVAKTTGKALFSGGAKTLLAGGLSGTFKNLTSVGKTLWGSLGGLTKGFLKFIPYVGIAIMAFEAFKLFGDLQKQQTQKIEGLGNTANLAADKLQYLADVTGTQMNSQGLGGGYQAEGSTSVDVAKESLDAVSRLKEESEEFKKIFEENLVAIANSAPRIAEASLASMAIQLDAAGFAPDVIAVIVEMLVQESKRTDLNLDFIALNVDGSIDVDKLKQKSNEAIEIVKQEVKRYNDEMEKVKSSTAEAIVGNDSFDTVGTNTYLANNSAENTSPSQDAGVIQSAMVAGAALGTQMEALNKKFAEGDLSAEDFNQEMFALAAAFEQIDSSVRGLAIDEASDAFGEDFAAALEKVNSETDKLLLLQAETTGIEFSDTDIESLNKDGQDAVDLRKKLNDEIANAGFNLAEERRQLELKNAADIQKVDLTAIYTEIDANKKIIDQAPELVARGLDEAEAIEALTDARWATIFARAAELDLEQQGTTNTDAAVQAYKDYQASLESVNDVRAKSDLVSQIAQLREQNGVLSWLTANGMGTAEALEVIGNSAFYAAAMAAMGAQDFQGFANQLAIITDLSSKISPASASSAKKSPFQESVDKLKEQRNEISNSINAFNKLRKAGFSVSAAFKSAKDPVLATALASTKVGTSNWKRLVGLIKEVDRAARQSKLLDLVAENKAGIALTKSFTAITPMLSKLGMSLEDIEGILGDADLAQAFIDDLKDGEINSRSILDIINQIPKKKQIDILFNMATPEGMTKIFEDAYARQQEHFDVEERSIEKTHRGIISAAEASVSSAQKTVEAVQGKIDALQTKVNDKQREIETTITRPIEKLNDSVSAMERQIELNFSRPIADLQEESSDLSHELGIMDKQTSEINKRYDDQAEKLEKIAEIGAEVAAQDKERLDIASAMSSGSAADVARAMQSARIAESQRAREKAAKAIEAAREREIANVRSESGRSREDIENRQYDISQKIYSLEEQSEQKQLAIRNIQDQIYAIEEKRAPMLLTIRGYEDDIYNLQVGELKTAEDALVVAESDLATKEATRQKALDAIDAQRLEWEDLKLASDAAKVGSDGYLTSLTAARDMVNNIKKAWDSVNTVTPGSVTGNVSNPTVPTPTGTGSGGASGGPAYDSTADRRLADTAKEDIREILGTYVDTKRNPKYLQPLKDRVKDYNTVVARMHAQGLKTYKKAEISYNPYAGGYFDMSRPGVSISYKSRGGMIAGMAMGGSVMGLSRGGSIFKALGSDTVPAMLTPGEFVVRKSAVDRLGSKNMESINNGTYDGNSVYNYEVNISVRSDANPDDIARAVMTQIKRTDAQRIRGNRLNG